jgi:hypothetical protein
MGSLIPEDSRLRFFDKQTGLWNHRIESWDKCPCVETKTGDSAAVENLSIIPTGLFKNAGLLLQKKISPFLVRVNE